MKRVLALLTLSVVSLAACGSDDTVEILVFQAAPDAIESGQSTQLVFAVDPSNAKVNISGLGDLTGQTNTSVTPTATTSYQLTATNGKATATQSVTVTVGATTANAIKVEPALATPIAGDQVPVTLTVLGPNGKPAPGFRGTLHITSTDPHATLPPDQTFTAADAGVKQTSVTLTTAGPSALIATEVTGKASIAGSATLTVRPAAAQGYQLSALPTTAVAGQSMVLTVTVLDKFGNIATSYNGQMRMGSSDDSDILPPAGAFVNGVRTVSVAFTKVGNHIAQVQDVAATLPPADTASVAIGPAAPFKVALLPASQATTAGATETFTATVFDVFNNTSTNYTGTLHFVASDVDATVPGDFTFGPGDAGSHDFSVTLKTAGTTTLTVTDTAVVGIASSTSWTVIPAAAASYRLTTLPGSAIAGQSLVLTVTVLDVFGNIATGYTGQMRMVSNDPSDILPPAGSFVRGQRTVSLAFTKVGSHIATVQDVALALDPADTSGVAVSPAAPFRVAVSPAHPATTAGAVEAFTATVFDGFNNLSTNYTGTLHFVASDVDASVPADFTFGPGDAGSHSFSVTLKTAGTTTLAATDTVVSGVTGVASIIVVPAAANSYRLTALPGAATAGQSLVLTVTVLDVFGNIATAYAGQMRLVSNDPSDILPPAGSFVNGQRTVSLAFTKVGSHIATVQDVALTLQSADTSGVAVSPAAPFRVAVSPAHPATTAGAVEAFTATVFDGFNNTSTNYTGTLHFVASDVDASVPADFTFGPGDAGSHSFSVTLKTAGTTTLAATDTVVSGVTGVASIIVVPAAANSYRLTTLPGAATAGQSLVLTVTVLDVFGNIATAYTGQMRLVSNDPHDILPPAGSFVNGQRSVSLAFTKVGSHIATVQDVALTLPSADTSAVAISPAAPFRVAVAPAHPSTIAGTSEAFTTTLFDFYDNLSTNYTGTLHFAATDPQADVPADFTFGAGDAGSHGFNVTLKTAGTQNLAISDTAVGSLSGTAAWVVGAAAANSCVASQAPATAPAGTVLGLTVAARDPFGNTATGYAGTVRLTATDGRANLPPDVTYSPGDAGSHAFSVSLLTTGSQTVTATDLANAAITCSLGVMITPAAPKLVLSLPANANAGYSVSVAVAVKDLFDNAIPTYAGTVTFASTDTGSGAATPAPITFTGSEGGTATTSATFVTIGTQTLSASDTGTPQAAGTTAASVHGLVYTAPNTGRVRLVANQTQTNTNTIQLDLMANERLEISTFFGGGPGSFSAGMDLPVDTTRVGGGTPLFTAGAALPLGSGAAAAMGVLGNDHVLYTVVSRKRVAGTIFSQVTEVQAGQVFYSVKLKLTPAGTAGTVFDGAAPLATYRAGVRDQWGNDFVGQSDIGVGKLEIR